VSSDSRSSSPLAAEAASDRTCPSCGGAGGGPFGRAGSAWDRDDYACPRCAGTGVLGLPAIALEDLDLAPELAPEEVSPVSRPGVAKTTPARKNERKRAAGDED
jgi:hypothetical protein